MNFKRKKKRNWRKLHKDFVAEDTWGYKKSFKRDYRERKLFKQTKYSLDTQ